MTKLRSYPQRVTVHFSEVEEHGDGGGGDGKHWRPRTRADCVDLPRPCPYVGCKYHLFLDVSPLGSIKFNFGDKDGGLMAMDETCSLDVADGHPRDMTEISNFLNVTPARVQQEVAQATLKLKVTSLAHHATKSKDDP